MFTFCFFGLWKFSAVPLYKSHTERNSTITIPWILLNCSFEQFRPLPYYKRKFMTNLDSILKSFAEKGPRSQSYGFSSRHGQMWELDHKEGWALKKWCFWTVVLEKTLESPLDCKEIQPVHPKGDQPWILIARTDAEAEFQYFGHLVGRTDSLEKNLMLRKIEGGRRRGRQRMRWWMASLTEWTWVWASSGR